MEREKDFSLRKLGLCGADDSISPSILGLLCQAYPFVEFGILFRPDKVSFHYVSSFVMTSK
jgi:hypothetical protein